MVWKVSNVMGLCLASYSFQCLVVLRMFRAELSCLAPSQL